MNGALRKATTVFRSALMQSRSTSVTSYATSRPKGIKMSTAERAAHISVIVGTFFAYPVWVLLHLREYRGIQE
uniref:Putative cytochrome c oxidase polypeptide viii n=1 Tax=Amblyomma americanum TaxID=6943 RepID=A0A0C9RR84_AMBAM